MVLSCAGQAWADPISFRFAVTVENVGEFFPGALSLGFGGAPALGSTMQAVFTADGPRIPPDEDPNPNSGIYLVTGTWTFVTRSSTSTFHIQDTVISVLDNIGFNGPGAPDDQFFMIGNFLFDRPEIRRFEAVANLDGDQSVFNSDKFPTSKDLLPMTGGLNVNGNFQNVPNGCSNRDECGADFFVSGPARIISGTPTPTPTPEPMSVLLFGPAALALAARQWRNRKHAN